MVSYVDIFNELVDNYVSDTENIVVKSIPFTESHKIGISHSRLPMFFVKCKNSKSTKYLDNNLEFISVQFERDCVLQNGDKVFDGVYTIISLKSEYEGLRNYFLEIVHLIIQNLSAEPSLSEIKVEIDKLLNLFSHFSKLPKKTVQGLWAELLVIEQAIDPDYLIKSWHVSSLDCFDFNDGIDKIEVKSTKRNRRIHTFSLNQLIPNEGANLLIMSTFVIETGIGISIFELIRKIQHKLKDKNLILKVNEVVAETLGENFNKSFDIYFDYQLAVDSMSYYNGFHIPSIKPEEIPLEVTNVKFDCDLTGIESIDVINYNSPLHIAVLNFN